MVHGASSAWFRLKWLSDVAALLSKLKPADIARIHQQGIRAQCNHATGLGLLLSARVFDTNIPARLLGELKSSAVLRRLERWCLDQLINPVEPTQRRFGTAMIHACQVVQLHGTTAKLRELRRKLVEARREREF
jgi:hypothetical protein